MTSPRQEGPIELQCEAVIFDLDGVLIDSTELITSTWRRWAAEQNLDFEELMQVAFGRRAVETISIVTPHLDAEAEADRLNSSEAFKTEGLAKVEGAAALVEALPAASWAVATSGTLNMATTRLGYAELPKPAALITSDDVERGKPHPEVFLTAAQRLGVAPERCVVFEDAPAGIAAGRNAGMRVVAVGTTHAREVLEGADVIVGSLSDVQVLPADQEDEGTARQSDGAIRLVFSH